MRVDEGPEPSPPPTMVNYQPPCASDPIPLLTQLLGSSIKMPSHYLLHPSNNQFSHSYPSLWTSSQAIDKTLFFTMCHIVPLISPHPCKKPVLPISVSISSMSKAPRLRSMNGVEDSDNRPVLVPTGNNQKRPNQPQ
ncbi:hypothetical protein Dimus_025737 [Dionaea muscipula]